jgi:subtilisin-like proprotein convertase family protein
MQDRFTLKSKLKFFSKIFTLLIMSFAIVSNITAQCNWTTSTVLTTPALDKPVAVVGTNLYTFAGVENGAIVAASQKFDGTVWSSILALPTAVEFPSAVGDGTNIFIMGGALTGTGAPQNTNYRYNVATNTYTTLAPSATSTWSHAAVFLGGRIYKIGGIGATPANSVEIYNIATNTWTAGANYPINAGFVSAVTDGTFIYAAGGIDAAGSNKTYRYDPATNTWNDAAIADLPATRWGAAHAFYRNGFVMAGGFVGADVNTAISATSISWDPTSNTWTALPNMPADRARFAGAILNDAIYVVGGRSQASAAFVGNTSNYSLFCSPLVACTGTPNPGNTLASAQAVCTGTSVTLSALNPTTGTGVTYQWQTSASATGPWVSASGASTLATYTTTPTLTQFYRVLVNCGAAQGNSIPIQVTVSNCSCITPDVATICEGTIQRLSVTLPPGTVQTFTSATTISIPSVGIATPYPSTLAVSGVLPGSTVQSVTISNVTHTFPVDIDVALTSPTGVSQTIMSDVGGTSTITNRTYVFNDAAPTAMTTATTAAGTYKPSNSGATDNFPAPGPGATFANATPLLSNYTGNMNGTWNLYTIDDVGGDLGSFSGYSITFAAPLPTAIWTGGTFFTDPAATIPYVAGTPATVVYVRPTATTTYTATIASGPCAGANNVTVTVLPRPVVAVSPLTSCASTTNMLTATGASAYAWTPTLGLSSANTASVTANPAATTTYTVEGTATNGCKSSATTTVNASPQTSVISAVGGSTFQVNETFTGAVPPAGWNITNNSAPVGTTSWFKAAATSPFPSPAGGTDFNYAAANFASTTTAAAGEISTWFLSPLVNIKNGDIITFKTRTTTGTFPDRLQLRLSTNGASGNVGTTAVSVGDFTTLLVDVNPNLTTTGYPLTWTTFTATVSGITGTVPGRFAFRYFVTNGGGGANSDFIGLDDVQYATPASILCPNITSNIKVDITGGVGPYTLVYNNGTANTTFNNYVSGTNIQVSPAATTTYTVVSVIGANGCAIPVSGIGSGVTVTVTQPTTITTQPNSTNVCVGNNGTFTVVPSVLNGTTYQWQQNTVPSPGTPVWTNITNGGVFSGATTATLTVTGATLALNGTTYRVVVTGACNLAGAINSTAATLNVNSPATVTVSTTTPVIVCESGSTTISATAVGNSLTYQWQVNAVPAPGVPMWMNVANGANYAGVTTSNLTINNVPTSFLNNQYRVLVTSGGCTATPSSAVTLGTINPKPVVTITASPITKLFPGLTTTLTAAVSPTPAATYQWTRNGVNVPGATTNRHIVNIDGLGIYTVKVTNTAGCASTATTPASITISDSVNKEKLFIYPSPNSGQFQVRYFGDVNDVNTTAALINVYDSKGARVFSRSYSPGAGYGAMNVDLSAYGSGVYRIDVLNSRGERIKTGSVMVF